MGTGQVINHTMWQKTNGKTKMKRLNVKNVKALRARCTKRMKNGTAITAKKPLMEKSRRPTRIDESVLINNELFIRFVVLGTSWYMPANTFLALRRIKFFTGLELQEMDKNVKIIGKPVDPRKKGK